MTARIALCAEEDLVRDASLLGLEGEDLDAQHWLDVFVTGAEARKAIGEDSSIEHAWVVSCTDVEPINLAASLKADRPELDVRMVHRGGDGSLLSRAHNALIDEVVSPDSFVRLYSEWKESLAGVHLAGAVAGAPAAGAAGDAAATGPAAGATATGFAVSARAAGLAGNASAAESSDSAPAAGLAADALAAEAAPSAPVLDLETQAITPAAMAEPAASAKPEASLALFVPRAVQQTRAFVMPVVSGGGGAGKSAVSVTSAVLAQIMGYRTLLLDYDLQFGDAAVLAGIQDPLALDVAMNRPELLEREIGKSGGLIVLAPPLRLEMAETVAHGLPSLLDAVAPRFDVIVANTGAAWAEQHAALLERSSAALFLVDQRASSVRACQHALELCERCGIASGPFKFAVNRCAKSAPLTSIDVSCALKGVPVFELKDGGRDVEDYLSAGAALDLVDSRNEFCESLKLVLSKLLPDGERRLAEAKFAPEPKGASRKRGRHVGRRKPWRQQ